MEHLSDEKLIDMYLGGNTAAFGEIYRRYAGQVQDAVLMYVRKYAPGLRQHLADIVQETFVRLHEKQQGFRGAQTVSAYLISTALRAAVDYARWEGGHKRDFKRTFTWEAQVEASAADIRHTEDQQQVQDFIAILPDHFQQVIRMCYFEGRTAEEIAGILGKPKSTIDWWKREALAMMQREAVGIPL